MSLVTAAPSEVAVIPLVSVRVVYNPRRAFKQEALQRLADSIREHDLIQPIAVRPADDSEGYELIAGERRLRAMRLLERAEAPARIIYCDAEEARRLSLLENTDRENLSVAEEALAARDELDRAGGDRAAAGSKLGWSQTKLASRLLLLKASMAVLDAVAEGTIDIGHAELLAGLPEPMQDKALGRVIANNVSVAALREDVKGVVIPLSTAIFDTGAQSACATCPFNTALQGTLFGEAVAGANCKNRQCFTEKTNTELEARRTRLQEDYATVALTTEKDSSSYTALIQNGEGGVGPEQYNACRGCQFFGALLHAKPDARLGQTERPICFNVECNREHVRAYAESQKPATEVTAEAPDSEAPAATGKPTGRKAPAGGKTASSAKGKATPTRASAPAASSGAAKAAMKPAYTAAAKTLLATGTKAPLAVAILAMAKVMNDAGVSLPDGVVVTGRKPEDVIGKLLSSEEAVLASLFNACATAMVVGKQSNCSFSRNDVFPGVIAASLVQGQGVDMATHFAVDLDFLAAHTKEGITALLEESGFKTWLLGQEDGEKRWKALLASKKADMPKDVMKAGFAWAGFVPSAVASISPRSFVGV